MLARLVMVKPCGWLIIWGLMVPIEESPPALLQQATQAPAGPDPRRRVAQDLALYGTVRSERPSSPRHHRPNSRQHWAAPVSTGRRPVISEGRNDPPPAGLILEACTHFTRLPHVFSGNPSRKFAETLLDESRQFREG